MFFLIRKILWRILGFDYQMMLNKKDYVLLKNDNYAKLGARTYDNGAKVWRWTDSPLKIGKYCSIAHGVNFIVDEGFHSLSSITNFPLFNNLFKDDIIKNPSLKASRFFIFTIAILTILIAGQTITTGVFEIRTAASLYIRWIYPFVVLLVVKKNISYLLVKVMYILTITTFIFYIPQLLIPGFEDFQ